MATIEDLKNLMEQGKAQAKAVNDAEELLTETMDRITVMTKDLLESADGEGKREIVRATFDMMKFGLQMKLERELRQDERAEALELLRSAGKNTGRA